MSKTENSKYGVGARAETFVVDSHCHLIFSHFKNGIKYVDDDFDDRYSVAAIIQRAADAGVKYILNIGTDLDEILELQAISEEYSGVFHTIGIHPQEASKHCQRYTSDEISRVLANFCRHPKVVGLGEIGLDYHYGQENKNQQQKLFNQQLELAKYNELPVSIHSRESSDDVVSLLKDHPDIRGVIHCFSGEKDFARIALDRGFYISISGVITYKNAVELHDALKFIPLNRLLIETDSPFLAPQPFRGKINEPSQVIYVAKRIADLLNISVVEVEKRSSENFFKLFARVVVS
ncbi:MAG: TatD family hydrolase [Holosporaceae bacterium]|jgi:TatD DNase family protein|nr:TatD family hydrolase [Holosporaceae bacterium]